MASVHRQKGKPYWFAAFYDADGTRRFRSTGSIKKTDALAICRAWDRAERQARRGNLTTERARRIIEEGLSDIMERQGNEMPRASIQQHFESWVKLKESSTATSTHAAYAGAANAFIGYLGTSAKRSLPSLTVEQVAQYRDHLVGRTRPGTVNLQLKILRMILKSAMVKRYIETNPAALVETIKNGKRHERRAFTLPELKKLLDAAGDTAWRTMILTGLYTGLRLQDIAGLTWHNVNLETATLTVETTKTGRTQIIPMARPLAEHLESIAGNDDPGGTVCPTLNDKDSSWLSNQFNEVMAQAGLSKSRKQHTAKKKGRDQRRDLSSISFHTLRYTATSLLKNAGVSDAIARDIIGHESAAMSRNYTHIDDAAKRQAVSKLPDITK